MRKDLQEIAYEDGAFQYYYWINPFAEREL